MIEPNPIDTLASRVVARAMPMTIVVAGGASGAIAALLRQPGASRTLLDAQIPYSQQALATYLGHLPQSICSPDTARLLAWRAWTNARQLANIDQKSNCFGVSCTAALATQPARRGADRAHFALCDGLVSQVFTLELDGLSGLL